MLMCRRGRRSAIFAGAVLSVSIGLHAGSSAAQTAGEQGDWEFYFSPYTWISGTTGTTRLNNERLPAQTSKITYGDLLSHLNSVPIIGASEARSGRFALLTDIMFTSLSGNVGTKNSQFNGASFKLTQLISTILPTY